MALMERFALCARCPAKSSVQSWLPGSKPNFVRYSAHLVTVGHQADANAALPS